MTQKTKPIPDGYHTITPFLSTTNAGQAIQFYQAAFGAKEIEKHLTGDGKVMHAVLKIGNSLIMLADEFPEYSCGMSAPNSLKGTTTMFHIYVEDVDSAFQQAVQAGAKVTMPVADMFWGDRYGQLEDPFGHLWSIGTHKMDITPDQLQEGASECCLSKHSCC